FPAPAGRLARELAPRPPAVPRSPGYGPLGDPQGPVEIPGDVVQILDADRHPHQIRADPCLDLILRTELLMGGGSRVNDQALGVADVGQVREEAEAIDKGPPGRETSLDPEGQDAPGSIRQVPLGQGMARARRQTGVADPGDGRVLLEEGGYRERVFGVTIDAEGERFQP